MDRDITGRAAIGAATILVQAHKLLKEVMPLGPSRVRMTPAELRKRLERSTPDTRKEILKLIGPDATYRLLTGREPLASGLFNPREVQRGT